MNSFYDFLNILILVGVIQGFITSILLWRLKTNSSANKILAWIILLISLTCLNIYFLETLKTKSTPWLIFEALFPMVVIMPIGPLIYFYVKALILHDFKISQINRRHFLTVILDLIPYLVTLTFIIGSILDVISVKNNYNWVGGVIDTYNIYVDIPRWLSLTIYSILSLKMISIYKKEEKNRDFLKWPHHFTIGFITFSVIWFFHLIPYIIPSLSNKLLVTVSWYPIYIPLIILVYWLGINGYIISFKIFKKTTNRKVLSEEEIQGTITTLEELMQNQRLYLNPTLKLNDVVSITRVPQKTISAVLNQHMGKTFNEYVNNFRIKEFKRRLLESNDNLTITGIAFECGFNSQATFQRTFKAMTNLTPKEFQQKQTKIK